MLDTTTDAMLVPAYLRDVYRWAYLTPWLADWLDRQFVVQTILWGNAQRLIDDVLAEDRQDLLLEVGDRPCGTDRGEFARKIDRQERLQHF